MNKEKLVQLKEAMELEKELNEKITIKKEAFEIENAALFLSQAKTREVIIDCKEVLTENAEEGFKADGEKKRLGGIGIRVKNLLDYDESKALSWAKEKDLFLQLDKKAFENVAKTGELDFVKIGEKITVTFPKEIKLEDD